MRAARIESGRVVELFDADKSGLTNVLNGALIATLHDVADDAGLGDWVVEPPPQPLPTADEVRAEAQRRMMLLVGARDAPHLDVILSNGTREAVRLLRRGGASWTADEARRAAVLEAIDAAIEAIRAASNAMEAAPPADFQDDHRWPRPNG